VDSGHASPESSSHSAESGLPSVAGYQVLRRIAVNAMSDVLLARASGPSSPERVVVLKVLLDPSSEDDDAFVSLSREIESYRRLVHPAIARLFDFFEDRGHRVIVLEYVDGVPLHRLRALLKSRGRDRIADPAAIFIAWRVFSALAAAHGALDPSTGRGRSVVHRDINPSHVLVPWDGHVKVGDFGISVALESADRNESGLIEGTYGYLAPEQATSGVASPRADVYSAGLVLWELLTGRKAIVRDAKRDESVVEAMSKPSFPALSELRPDLPKAVLGAVARALDPEPDKRTIDAQSMCDALRISGNLEEGRVALVEILSVIRPSAVADLLFESAMRPKATSEFWSEPTRKVDLPMSAEAWLEMEALALSSSVATPAEFGQGKANIGLPRDSTASSVRDSAASQPLAPPRPRGSELPTGGPATTAAGSPRVPSGPGPTSEAVPGQRATIVSEASARAEAAAGGAFIPGDDAGIDVQVALEAETAPAAVPMERVTSAVVPPVGQRGEPEPSNGDVEQPRRRSSTARWGIALGLLAAVSIAAMYAWDPLSYGPSNSPKPSVTSVPTGDALVGENPVASSVSLAPAPVLSTSDPATPGQRTATGKITVGPAQPGHRVWIDGRLMGEESPSSYVVPCGRHVVQVGSRGSPQTLDVACGAEVEAR